MKIERVIWDDHAERVLAPALGSDRDFLYAEWRIGQSSLFKFENGSYMLCRADNADLVVIAFAGSDLNKCSDFIVSGARNLGFRVIRFHTKRLGLEKLIAHHNPEPVEYVYCVRVN